MIERSSIRTRRRYQVNLVEQQALGDLNYVRLMRLMPDLDSASQWSFRISGPDGDWRVTLSVEERARFTTSVLISRHQGDCEWTRFPALQVRLYHDANMAEVIAWERHRVKLGRYSYPNNKMYQCDEKAQLNRFLGEWLSHCLAQGKANAVNLKLTG
ncbi:DUF1249 domain-containing protein [Simiduia litorea]|uniref:DUF1249 domain-containing protein n=1 Tax=Simiduia litorea TaxID=1435348 RepID=UPI0036F2E9B8